MGRPTRAARDSLPRLPAAAADPYAVLGVSRQASAAEIKAAYRALVKQHHPDAGGDPVTILALNAAWEVLGDGERRRAYDHHRQSSARPAADSTTAPASSAEATAAAAASARAAVRRSAARDQQLSLWLRRVYAPIDRLLGQVINPFPAQLRALASDPYDDALMAAFCSFLQQSQGKLQQVDTLFRSMVTPPAARSFGLSLYHCLSQVQDALSELERYTMGYVDSYLRDGREMMREAKRRRSLLQQERRRLLG